MVTVSTPADMMLPGWKLKSKGCWVWVVNVPPSMVVVIWSKVRNSPATPATRPGAEPAVSSWNEMK